MEETLESSSLTTSSMNKIKIFLRKNGKNWIWLHLMIKNCPFAERSAKCKSKKSHWANSKECLLLKLSNRLSSWKGLLWWMLLVYNTLNRFGPLLRIQVKYTILDPTEIFSILAKDKNWVKVTNSIWGLSNCLIRTILASNKINLDSISTFLRRQK